MKIILAFTLLFFSLSMSAQSDYITIKTVPKKVKKCYDSGLEYAQKSEYTKALEHFNKAINKSPRFIDAHLQRASIYYEQKNYPRAITGFKDVLSFDPEYNKKIYYTLGSACFKQGDYACAEENLTQYLSSNPTNKILLARANNTLISARTAKDLSKEKYKIELNPLPEAINTTHSEYLPSFSLDGRTLIFTRRINRDEDFYASIKKDSVWSEALPLNDINTGNNEGAQTLSADGSLLIFTGCTRRDGHGSCDLYYSYHQDSTWTTPKNMGDVINTPGWESQPSLSVDGQTLYFASNRAGGEGGNDIWMSVRTPKDHFDTPINLGKIINTDKNEFAPVIHADDRTLYFTSDGHPGFGDTDLFMSRQDLKGNWEKPVNLGAPINTNAAEGALAINTYGDTAYFARTQEGAQAQEMDIYSFVLPEKLRPTPVTYIQARIINKKNNDLISQAELILIDNNTGLELLRKRSKTDGSFLIALPLGTDYAFRIEKENFNFYSARFDLKKLFKKDDPFIYNIELSPIEDIMRNSTTPNAKSNTPIILENVFFESNKYDFLEASIPELASLSSHLNKYPNLIIQINGHTDNVGNDSDNLTLSERRAQSVYQYLIKHGIAPARISYKGYGETRPIADNDTEEGRSQNRRTEFTTLKSR